MFSYLRIQELRPTCSKLKDIIVYLISFWMFTLCTLTLFYITYSHDHGNLPPVPPSPHSRSTLPLPPIQQTTPSPSASPTMKRRLVSNLLFGVRVNVFEFICSFHITHYVEVKHYNCSFIQVVAYFVFL